MKKILLPLFILMIISYQLNAQWHWQNPTPIGKPIHDMQFIDSLHGYICGVGGMLLKTNDGGLKWEELQVPTEGLIQRIFFLDKNIGWYLSYSDRSLYKTTDAGMNWSFVSSFAPRYATTMWFTNELNGFAGGYNYLLKTTDGGISWTEDTRISSAYSIYFLNETTGFISSHNKINKTTDGGNTWIYKVLPVYSLNPAKIFAYNLSNIYAVGTGEDIYGNLVHLFCHTSTGGSTWITKSFEQQVSDVFFETPSKGFICSKNILMTSNGGESWDTTAFSARQFRFIGNHSWGANYNTVDYSNDDWQTAAPQIKGVFSGYLWDGCAKDTNIVFACGSYKTIIGSKDGGKIWNKYYSSDDNVYLNAVTINHDEIWAVGQHGIIVYSRDNGITWFEKYLDTEWLNDITFLSNGTGYISGTLNGAGAIFTSLNGGDDWELLEDFSHLLSIDKIKFSGDTLGWATGYPSAVLRTTTGGISWDLVQDTVFGVSNIAVSGDSVWITHGNNVLRSTNAGAAWESFKVFDYNTIIFGGCDIDFINSKTGYVIAYDSRVFKTTDGGETWAAENYPKGLSNFAVDFVNEEVGWAFGYPGIVLKRNPSIVSVDDYTYQNNDLNTFSLIQNYPNPYNSQTTLSFSIPNSSLVQIQVFDILGRRVAVLLNEEKAAGNYNINFNAAGLTSGVYFYRLQAGEFIETRKMILLR